MAYIPQQLVRTAQGAETVTVRKLTSTTFDASHGFMSWHHTSASVFFGSVTSGSSPENAFILRLGEHPSSSISLINRRRVNASPGQVVEIGHSVKLLEPLTGSRSLTWGLYDDDEGYGFGADVTGAFVFVRNAGTDSVTRQTSWNIDKLDGAGSSAYALTLLTGALTRITHDTTGFGMIEFGAYGSVGGRPPVYFPAHRIFPDFGTMQPLCNLPLAATLKNNGMFVSGNAATGTIDFSSNVGNIIGGSGTGSALFAVSDGYNVRVFAAYSGSTPAQPVRSPIWDVLNLNYVNAGGISSPPALVQAFTGCINGLSASYLNITASVHPTNSAMLVVTNRTPGAFGNVAISGANGVGGPLSGSIIGGMTGGTLGLSPYTVLIGSSYASVLGDSAHEARPTIGYVALVTGSSSGPQFYGIFRKKAKINGRKNRVPVYINGLHGTLKQAVQDLPFKLFRMDKSQNELFDGIIRQYGSTGWSNIVFPFAFASDSTVTPEGTIDQTAIEMFDARLFQTKPASTYPIPFDQSLPDIFRKLYPLKIDLLRSSASTNVNFPHEGYELTDDSYLILLGFNVLPSGSGDFSVDFEERW